MLKRNVRLRRIDNALRELPAVSQREVAARLGFTESDLSKCLSGRWLLAPSEYARIYDAICEIRADKIRQREGVTV